MRNAFWIAAVLGTLMSGCATTDNINNTMEKQLAYRHELLDDSKLYWCINAVNVGKIKRGMTKQSLKEIFGNELHFDEAGRSALCDLTLPRKSKKIVQLPPPWQIQFIFNVQGTVDDYAISRDIGK